MPQEPEEVERGIKYQEAVLDDAPVQSNECRLIEYLREDYNVMISTKEQASISG